LPLSNEFKGDSNEEDVMIMWIDDGEDSDDDYDNANDRGFRNNLDSILFNRAVVVVTFVVKCGND